MSSAHHVVPLRIYFTIFFLLIVLTGFTVFVSKFDFGIMNLPVALSIAIVKATLIMLFFMHVKYSSRLTQLFVLSGFFFMGILFFFTFCDYLTRAWN